jgi:preprotein translocase subunit SecE
MLKKTIEQIAYFFRTFIPEVKAEWKKVTSPSRREVWQSTLVVVVASFIFAIYLKFSDVVIQRLLEGLFSVVGA